MVKEMVESVRFDFLIDENRYLPRPPNLCPAAQLAASMSPDFPLAAQREGWNQSADEGEYFFISNPALGLWASQQRMASDPRKSDQRK